MAEVAGAEFLEEYDQMVASGFARLEPGIPQGEVLCLTSSGGLDHGRVYADKIHGKLTLFERVDKKPYQIFLYPSNH